MPTPTMNTTTTTTTTMAPDCVRMRIVNFGTTDEGIPDVEVAIFNDVDSEVDSLNTDDTGLVWFCGFAGVSKNP